MNQVLVFQAPMLSHTIDSQLYIQTPTQNTPPKTHHIYSFYIRLKRLELYRFTTTRESTIATTVATKVKDSE